MIWNLTRILAGFVLLTGGSSAFVAGCVALARRFRVPEYAIGASLVALGTSLPELVTSLYAASVGRSDIALGNVVGSNLVNVGIVFGITAAVSPFFLQRDVFRQDATHLLLSAILLAVVGADGSIDRSDALFLLTLGILYTVELMGQREESDSETTETGAAEAMSSSGIAMRLLAGLLAFTAGAGWLVDGASDLARGFGIPEWIIGLTVVALGTSLPEMATSITAAFRGAGAIAVGNVIGSNVLNIYVVLGAAALVSPVRVDPMSMRFDIPALLAMVLPFLFVLQTQKVRREYGAAMIVLYLAILGTSVRLHPVL